MFGRGTLRVWLPAKVIECSGGLFGKDGRSVLWRDPMRFYVCVCQVNERVPKCFLPFDVWHVVFRSVATLGLSLGTFARLLVQVRDGTMRQQYSYVSVVDKNIVVSYFGTSTATQQLNCRVRTKRS
ncbi:hypothetical protein WS91_22690 [Burkholderia sp. MSMB1498]|nr:hypothetical protein WS91_22690 [Burkholderia sp. MSMB1498]